MSMAAKAIAANIELGAKTSTPPTLSQIYGTLRLCLRYMEDDANIFTQLLKLLETVNFLPFVSKLPHNELERFLHMAEKRLVRIQLEIGHIRAVLEACRKRGVASLSQVSCCELLPCNIRAPSAQLLLLGELLPNLQQLKMLEVMPQAVPQNLRQLTVLQLHKATSQAVLEQIFDNCPQLQQLQLCNDTALHSRLDIRNIHNCRQLHKLQLPLLLHSALSLCQLQQLQHLSLQHKHLWPGSDWLPIIRDIIAAKRHELRSLIIDGTWLPITLQLASLRLQSCWALTELLLSNCKLSDQYKNGSVLPLSLQRLSFKHCQLLQPLCYLRYTVTLQTLELHGCQLLAGQGQLLQQLLQLRKRLPTIEPLTLQFSESTPLRSEFTGLSRARLEYFSEWLRVQELHESALIWQQQPGMVSMIFGNPITGVPQLELK